MPGLDDDATGAPTVRRTDSSSGTHDLGRNLYYKDCTYPYPEEFGLSRIVYDLRRWSVSVTTICQIRLPPVTPSDEVLRDARSGAC